MGIYTEQRRELSQLKWPMIISVLGVLIFKGLQYTLIKKDIPEWQDYAGYVLLTLAAVPLLSMLQRRPVHFYLLAAGSAVLFALALDVFIHKNYQVHNLIEHALQYAMPLLFALWYFKRVPVHVLQLIMAVLIALTFAGHGLYALGLELGSTNFIPMTTSILGVDGKGAETFLLIAGILDFVVVFGLFLPGLRHRVVLWAIAWGLITAFARVYYFGVQANGDPQWLQAFSEMGYRLCHGLVPLAFLFSLRK